MVLVECGVGFETCVNHFGKCLTMESKPTPSLSREGNVDASKEPSNFVAEVLQADSTPKHSSRSSVLSSSPLELHRRCRETIERCAAKLRERQRKMERLQVVLPSPKTKRTTKQHPCGQGSAAPSRSTPPRPVKRNKLGSTSIFDRRENSPTWSSSSISVAGSRHSLRTTPPASRFNEMTASPFLNRKAAMQTRTKHASASSITDSLSSDPSQEIKQQGKHENSQDTHQFSPANESSGPGVIRSMTSSPTWSQRQQAFTEAIEAEAHSDA